MKSHDATVRRALGIVGVAAALSACGSTGDASAGPVTTKELAGVGTVLVDTTGKTLYFTDSEPAGTFACTGDCLGMWQPATAPGDRVDGVPADVGVVKRPDGTNQLAYRNQPLYTFTLDSADKPASGNNASDSFGGMRFTWHAVVVGAAAPAPAPAPATGDDGYGGGGGGY